MVIREFRKNFLDLLDSFEVDFGIESIYRKWVTEEDDKYIVKFVVPGYSKEDVKVVGRGQTLDIELNRKGEKLRYKIYLGLNTDLKKSRARVENGILTVTIPKKEGDKIVIKVD